MPIPPGSKLVGGTSVPPPPGTPILPPAPAGKVASQPNIKKYLSYICVAILAFFLAFGAFEAASWMHDGGNPTPPPTPAPSGTLWVTLIHDPDSPTQEFAHIESDSSLTEFINLQKGHLRIVPKDSTLVKSHNFTQFVDKYGTPTLIMQSEESKKITAEKCPATAANIIDEIKKYKGIK